MKKVLTVIFDGFGMRDEVEGNAVKAAKMHNFEEFYANNPHTTLYASEEYIGLLPGQMGNSEVGHMTIGAGRLIKSSKEKIQDFFTTGYIENEAVKKLAENNSKTVHMMGLCSDGNIHAGVDDFLYMTELLNKLGFKKIYYHLITDGRDTGIESAYTYIKMVQDKGKELKIGKVATICGRYYAMDRDKNYDRTQKYYNLVTKGTGTSILNIEKGLKDSYAKNETDEFIKPMIVDPTGLIKNGDILIWMNFRNDRAKQILSAFTDPSFDAFPVYKFNDLNVYSFFTVDKNITTIPFLGDNVVDNPLGIYFSKLNLKQARVAESEKYAHVTYFFDGGFEGKIPNCDKFHIPSPDVPTYDLKPEMSAVGVTQKIIECMEKDYDFIFANFANPDMVGHTGSMEAATKACMAIDICLGKILEKAEENFYTVFLLADHGNCDTMINPDGTPCTTHSLAKVPFVVNDPKVHFRENGNLTNVAPTILDYMDIAIPSQMTSNSILEKE